MERDVVQAILSPKSVDRGVPTPLSPGFGGAATDRVRGLADAPLMVAPGIVEQRLQTMAMSALMEFLLLGKPGPRLAALRAVFGSGVSVRASTQALVATVFKVVERGREKNDAPRRETEKAT